MWPTLFITITFGLILWFFIQGCDEPDEDEQDGMGPLR